MKIFKYLLLFISYLLLFTSCKNNSTVDNSSKKPEIIHLQNTYYSKFYYFNNFNENETCIKYLFDFANKNTGHLDIVSNKNSVRFEDGYSIDNLNSQRFAFARKENTLKNTYIRTNFLKTTPIHFTIKEAEIQKELTADFDTLTVNTVQNFLDYAKKDETKKEHETFTYILYNKSNREKMKLIYHEYGDWFEVEIL